MTVRPSHEGHLTVIREESERLLAAIRTVSPDTPVPTCEGWTAADLTFHLAGVQHVWAQVADGATSEELDAPARPADDELVGLLARSGTELLLRLSARDPDEPCWSWHDDGGTIGWVARRQAHEALIHRVDAELTAGHDVTPPTAELAADGVDEVLHVMVGGVPAWGTFTPDGRTVRVSCTNVARAWALTLGRFTGTSPTTGEGHDLDAASVRDVDVDHPADPADPAAHGQEDLVVLGSAWDLDRWLWGRGDETHLDVTGAAELLARFRSLLEEATQ